jgi:peroxiredoxin
VEAPHLQQLHRKYFARGLRVIGVTPLKAPVSDIRAFVDRHGVTYPTLVDPDEKVISRYGFRSYPTTVLIDHRGVVRSVHTGFRIGDEKALEERIRSMLQAGPASARKGGR